MLTKLNITRENLNPKIVSAFIHSNISRMWLYVSLPLVAAGNNIVFDVVAAATI